MEVYSSGLVAILLLSSITESVGKKLIDDKEFIKKIKPLVFVFFALVVLLIFATILFVIAYKKRGRAHSLEYKDSPPKGTIKMNSDKTSKYSYDNQTYENNYYVDMQEVKKKPESAAGKDPQEKAAFDNPVYQTAH